MIKELQYKGYATEPSDYECPDGQLATSFNIINEYGALRPILPMKTRFVFPQGYKIATIHKTATYEHFIFINEDNNQISWIDSTELQQTENIAEQRLCDNAIGNTIRNIRQITPIGNTLAVITEGAMEFLLWVKGSYKTLGQKPKPIQVKYSVTYKFDHRQAFNDPYYFTSTREDDNLNIDDIGTGHRTVQNSVDAIFAAVHDVENSIKRNGAFWNPFYIRLAYRTVADTHIMLTSPFLVVPNSTGKPIVHAVKDLDSGKQYVHALMYGVRVSLEISKIPEEWEDVITSIDVFITPQMQNFTEDNETLRNMVPLDDDNECRRAFLIDNEGKKLLFTGVADNPLKRVYYIPFQNRLDDKTFREVITEESRFYLYKSIKPGEFENQQTISIDIRLKKDEYESLTSRETLDGDNMSRDNFIVSAAYAFNNRLNIASEALVLSPPENPQNIIPYFQHDGTQPLSDTIVAIAAEVSQNEKTYFTEFSPIQISPIQNFYPNDCLLNDPYYCFYPNPNASALILKVRLTALDDELQPEYSYYLCRLPLKTHPILNGAYAFNDFEPVSSLASPYDVMPEDFTPDDVVKQSRLYTSETDVPFIFDKAGLTIGNGKIMKICTAVKALSPGQYGQFPLYAFTEEGIWALSISDTGLPYAPKAVSGDICSNIHGITQLERTVVFPTNKGVMELNGNEMTCITDSINSQTPFSIQSLPYIEPICTMVDNVETCLIQPFNDFVRHCQIYSDYDNQRIIIFNSLYPYAYVYSRKSGQWATIASSLRYSIEAYPGQIAVTADNHAVTSSVTDDTDTLTKALVITRPLKLDNPDILKDVQSVIQRGIFRNKHLKTILYASRDLYSWYIVWSSRDHYLRGFSGTPYKYYRIAIVAELQNDECISGCSVNFKLKFNNQIR